MSGKLKPLVLKYLDESIFNIEEIMQLKKRFFAGVDVGTTILMYQMWKEKWLD